MGRADEGDYRKVAVSKTRTGRFQNQAIRGPAVQGISRHKDVDPLIDSADNRSVTQGAAGDGGASRDIHDIAPQAVGGCRDRAAKINSDLVGGDGRGGHEIFRWLECGAGPLNPHPSVIVPVLAGISEGQNENRRKICRDPTRPVVAQQIHLGIESLGVGHILEIRNRR